MDNGLSPSRTALLAVCSVTIGLLALTEQFMGLLVAVPTFVAAGWVFRWEDWLAGSNDRAAGVTQE